MADFFGWVAKRISNRPRPWVMGMLLLGLVAAWPASEVELDNDFRQFFDTDSADSQFYAAFEDLFGTDETGLLILLEQKSGDSSALVRKVERLSAEIFDLKFVERVDSITQSSLMFSGDDDDLLVTPAFGENSMLEGSFSQRLDWLRASSLAGERLISSDGRLTLIHVTMEKKYRDVKFLSEPLGQVRSIVKNIVGEGGDDFNYYYGGIPFSRLAAIEVMQGDLSLLFPLTLVVIAGLLYVLFRRKHAVILPLLAIVVSCLITLAAAHWLNYSLSPLSSIFPILLLVIAVADGVHLLSRYHEEKRKGASYQDAIRITVREVGSACLLTSSTTAVGFLSLWMTDLEILKSFGTVVSIGVMTAFVVVVVLVSGGVAASRSEAAQPVTFVFSGLRRFMEWFLTPAKTMVAIVVGLAFCLGGVHYSSMIRVNHFVKDSMSDEHEVSIGNHK
ncbi:MAG: MMPL family transporter, partial [Myxococcota bacterium]|nr:MMPL family transporter [Myxococcota bacterium]